MSADSFSDLELIKLVCKRHCENIIVKKDKYGWQGQYTWKGIKLVTPSCRSEARCWVLILAAIPEFGG